MTSSFGARRRLSFAVPACLACLLACGGRSNLSPDGPALVDCAPTSDAAAPFDAGAPVADATVVVPSVDAAVDADAAPDAGPAPACHFVLSGPPVPTISFAASHPTYSFHQEGLLLRSAPPRGTAHVVQYGSVDGAGTDGWGDPAMYAAEYDVSVWPPVEVHAPTRISDADEGAGSLTALPDDELLFTWMLQVDNGGLGPTDILFDRVNATSWQSAGQGTLVKHAIQSSAPSLSRARDRLFLPYVFEDTGDAGDVVALPPLVGLDGRLGAFALSGAALSDPLPIWGTAGAEMTAAWYYGRQGVTRTATNALVALAFPDCGPGLTSDFCAPQSIVLLRVVEPADGGTASLERAASFPIQNTDDAVQAPSLMSDEKGHTWLTWWEAPQSDAGPSGAQNLYAVPLSDTGEPAGPVESWFASDRTAGLLSLWDRTPTVGPLGTVYPVSTGAVNDAGTYVREVHLLHRQLDVVAPLEDLVFTTPYTAYSVVAVQVAEPRSLIVGYSTYPEDPDGASPSSFAELARYTCAEDAN